MPISARIRRPNSWHFAVLALLLTAVGICGPLKAQNDEPPDHSSSAQGPLAAAVYASGWALDATGYHPAVLIEVENAGNTDLSGQLIRFQAMFADRRDGQVVRAREELRKNLAPRHRTYVWLQSSTPFQLPIDIAAWPRMDVKVMYRIGEVGDEGTHTLFITDLRTQTTTKDDALIEMSRIQPFSQTKPPAYYQSARRGASASATAKATPARRGPPKPLAAPPAAALKPPPTNPASDNRSTLLAFVSSRAMPGIGDDFYDFERVFGLPAGTDAKSAGWTWALYKKEQPALSVFTGSKGQTGKVDILVMSVPAADAGSESTIEQIARTLAGKLKTQKLGAPVRSVRYLPSGRTQFVTRSAPGYKLSYLTPRGAAPESNTYVIILSRLPGALDVFLSEHSKRSELLRPLSPLFGAG